VDDRLILMGVIGRPHGVRGLVRVNAFTADPQALADYPLIDSAGRRFNLEWVGGGVARLTELTAAGARAIADRDAAERLVNTELHTPRSALRPADDDEFYLADLVGLTARDADGATIGRIAAVHDYGGGASLEIAPGGTLVPFTREAVPVVDVAGGHVTVIPPAEIAVAP
jgi:16S rRNA processing protein RimM